MRVTNIPRWACSVWKICHLHVRTILRAWKCALLEIGLSISMWRTLPKPYHSAERSECAHHGLCPWPRLCRVDRCAVRRLRRAKKRLIPFSRFSRACGGTIGKEGYAFERWGKECAGVPVLSSHEEGYFLVCRGCATIEADGLMVSFAEWKP